MPIPKSTLKFKRDGIEYTDSVDKANYLIEELTRAALKDVGRLVMRECAKRVKGINSYMRRRKWVTRRYQMWVRKKESDLIVGIANTKYAKGTAWWGEDAELGEHNQPKRGILRGSVYDNIDKIREIEAHYLSAIDDERRAEAMIDEDELQEGAE